MIIEKVDADRECFGDYALDGTVLTVGGIAVDLCAEQEDQEVIITFAAKDGVMRRGWMPCCNYVAEVLIPPKKYESVEVPSDDKPDDGDKDESEDGGGLGKGTQFESVTLPLDVNAVTLRLWPIVEELQDQSGIHGGEDGGACCEMNETTCGEMKCQ